MLSLVHVFGLMLMVFGLTCLVPVAVSIGYDDGAAWDFLVSLALTWGSGYPLWRLTRRFQRELKPRDGFLLVVFFWIGMAGVGAIPLLLHIHGMSFTDAYFESMSGLSTTGATVLTGLDHLPPAINFWRHQLNWMGGMGIIVLAVAVLPLLGVGGMQLYKAETPGPMKDAKLTPRITETAKNLWLIYAVLTLLCMVSLRLAGMSWLDAVCHAFAALSLGGFSTHDASIGYFDSPLIEAILIVFMLLGAMNFATHFVAWRQRSALAYRRDSEAKAMLLVIGVSCLGLATYIWSMQSYASWWTALRHVTFNLVSIATDCGFVSTDYEKWPVFVPLWMLFLSCICACSGSTGGGIKMIRTLILARQAHREMVTLIHPAAVTPVKIGGQALPTRIVISVLAFIFVYFISVVSLTFVLVLSGLDFMSAFSAIIASINNAGPGLNVVGPSQNYSALSDLQIWVCSLAMVLGRLEVFSLLILFTPEFWRK